LLNKKFRIEFVGLFYNDFVNIYSCFGLL